MIPLIDDVAARRYPVATVSLIAVNLIVFLYELSLPEARLDALIANLGVTPSSVCSPVGLVARGPLTIVTSMFLHAGWLHLIGNVWYLWIFGDNVEDRMGHGRFLVFYLLCGTFAAAVQIGFSLENSAPMIGASGAIAGVLGAYLLSYPFARVLTLIPLLLFWPVVHLPALIVLGSWFLVQLGSAWMEPGGVEEGVAWWAHIGGFAAGMLLVNLFSRAYRPHMRRSAAP